MCFVKFLFFVKKLCLIFWISTSITLPSCTLFIKILETFSLIFQSLSIFFLNSIRLLTQLFSCSILSYKLIFTYACSTDRRTPGRWKSNLFSFLFEIFCQKKSESRNYEESLYILVGRGEKRNGVEWSGVEWSGVENGPFIDKIESFVLFFLSLLPSFVFIHALYNR